MSLYKEFIFPRAIRVVCIEGNESQLLAGEKYWLTGVVYNTALGKAYAIIRGAGKGWDFSRFEQVEK